MIFEFFKNLILILKMSQRMALTGYGILFIATIRNDIGATYTRGKWLKRRKNDKRRSFF